MVPAVSGTGEAGGVRLRVERTKKKQHLEMRCYFNLSARHFTDFFNNLFIVAKYTDGFVKVNHHG